MKKDELISIFRKMLPSKNCERKFTQMAMGIHSDDILKSSGWRKATLKKDGKKIAVTLQGYPGGISLYTMGEIDKLRFDLNEKEGEKLLKEFHDYHENISIERINELL